MPSDQLEVSVYTAYEGHPMSQLADESHKLGFEDSVEDQQEKKMSALELGLQVYKNAVCNTSDVLAESLVHLYWMVFFFPQKQPHCPHTSAACLTWSSTWYLEIERPKDTKDSKYAFIIMESDI